MFANLGCAGFAHDEGLMGAGDDRSLRSGMSMFGIEDPLRRTTDAFRRIASDGRGIPGRLQLRLAALLHDIGRVSVPNDIWATRGPLDWSAWERVRLHSHDTGRVLGPIEPLAQVADIAAAAHQ
jgi:hypothetical protein